MEDLEWSSGSQSIALYIRRSPPQITMCAQGLGELLIALPVRPRPLADISQRLPVLPLEGILAPSRLFNESHSTGDSRDLCHVGFTKMRICIAAETAWLMSSGPSGL